MSKKVVSVSRDGIQFEDGFRLLSEHDQDCCESHWLDFSNLSMYDFSGLEFEIEGDQFFARVPGYGIELLPIAGHPIRIPGYGSNNGYYNSDLALVVTAEGYRKEYNITECQEYEPD